MIPSYCPMVVIGASAGGVHALQYFFKAAPRDPSVAYLVVIHMTKSSSLNYPLIYGDYFKGEISEIQDKMDIQPGHLYFAPSEYHVLLEKDGSFSLTQDEMSNFARPSIDVTFSSVAETLGPHACGVLLTGSNEDGAKGLKQMADLGSFTLVQDPKTCEYSAMPMAALDLFKPNAVLGIADIAKRVAAWAKEN